MTTILIGVGEFGGRVLKLMESDSMGSTVFNGLLWEVNTEFDPSIFKRQLLDCLASITAYLRRKAFNYYIVANIGEPAAALHVLELAKAIRRMEEDNLLFMRDGFEPGQLVGFTTLSERIGHTDEYSDTEVSAAAWYFKEADGELGTSFDRHYVYISPGGRDRVLEKTSRVLFQRMLLEAKFFPKDQMRRLLVAKQNLGEPLGHTFSSFSFIQIPRLSELQRYQTRFTFERLALELALNPPLSQNVKQKMFELWLKALDLPSKSNKGFPIDRVREIFLQSVEIQLLAPRGYPENDLQNLDTTLLKFIEAEFNIISDVIREGIDILLQVPRLYGAFPVYVEFLNELKDIVEKWAIGIETEKWSKSEELSTILADINRNVTVIERSRALSLPIFDELRKRLVRLVIQSSNLEDHVRRMLTAKIAEYLPQYLDQTINAGHPLSIISERTSDIEQFIEGLKKARNNLYDRADLVNNLLDSYYIRCPIDISTFRDVVARLNSKLFPGSGKSNVWEQYQQRVFIPWQESLGGDTQLAHKEQSFLQFVNDAGVSYQDSPAITEALENFSGQEREFHCDLARRLLPELDTIMGRTFLPSGIGKSMSAFFIFAPEGSPQDFLSEVIGNLKEIGATNVPVERSDTLGSVIAIREWYFMGIDDLAFWPNLKPHATKSREKIAELIFVEQSLDILDRDVTIASSRQKKLLVNILSETLTKADFLNLWNLHNKESTDITVDDVHIKKLLEQVTVREVLEILSEEDLRKLARDLDTVAGTSREKNIENLEAVISVL
jgi:hypothetical protein